MAVFGKLVPSVTCFPKSSKLLTVVVANLKLTNREWGPYGLKAQALEATYSKGTKGIATVKTRDMSKRLLKG